MRYQNESETGQLQKTLAKTPREPGAKDHELVRQFNFAPKYKTALQTLPLNDGALDASPDALRQRMIHAQCDNALTSVLKAATTPAPLRPGLTRPIRSRIKLAFILMA